MCQAWYWLKTQRYHILIIIAFYFRTYIHTKCVGTVEMTVEGQSGNRFEGFSHSRDSDFCFHFSDSEIKWDLSLFSLHLNLIHCFVIVRYYNQVTTNCKNHVMKSNNVPFFSLFFFSFKCACTFSFQNMQTGHVQQSRHGRTIREQPVRVGSLKVWLPYSFFLISSSAELTTNFCSNMATYKNDSRPSDNKAINCKQESHICHPNSALWRRLLPDDAWNKL